MSIKEKNLAVLRALRPELLELYESGNSGDAQSVQSKSCLPVFKYKSVAFHSLYRPEEEGRQFAQRIPAELEKIFVYGMGYGYHLSKIIDSAAKLTVLEPSVEIFCSAVEQVDISRLLQECDLVVGGDLRKKIEEADLTRAALFAHAPYLRFFEDEYQKIESLFLVRSYIAEKGLKVMLVGPIYGGTETTFRYMASALRRIGTELVEFDSSQFADSFFKLDKITPNKQHSRQLKGLFSRFIGEAIVAAADHERPDLILAVAQAPLEAAVIDRLKELKVPVAFWFVENYRTLGYWESVASRYDYFFTIQRGGFFEKLAKAGATNVCYLPQAASSAHHVPLELTAADGERYGSDLSFMGAGYANRQNFFHGLLDYDFKIWGTEWELNDELGKRVVNKNARLDPDEYIKIYNASKINLNLHSSSVPGGIDPVGDFVNPRVFEVAACGGFSLVDYRDELPPLLEPGKEIETFNSVSELREKADYYLRHDEERSEIAEAGRRRVLADHTFERRMEELLRIIIENEGDAPDAVEEKTVSKNQVGKMIEEAADDPELVAFLQGFDAKIDFPLKEAVTKISQGSGGLSRVESLILMVDQLLVVE